MKMAPPGIFESLDMDTMFRFIETLQLLPCLYDRNSEAYNFPKKREHKAERKKAYAELLHVLRKNDLHKDATLKTAKCMVKSTFSLFQTQHLNLSRNPNYHPKVWYPALAAFLLSNSDTRPASPMEVNSDEDDLDDASTIRRSPSLDVCKVYKYFYSSYIVSDDSDYSSVYYRSFLMSTKRQTDSNCLPENKPDEGKRVLRPLQHGISSSGYSSGAPDTSTNNPSISPSQAKRSKYDSSFSTSSPTSSSCSIDEAFGSYIMMALRNMKQEQSSKAKVEIFQILERGINGHL